MGKAIQMQLRLFFSHSSQVIYMLLVCFAVSLGFSITSENPGYMISISIPIISAVQISPKLFVSEKENRTFETLLTLPLTWKEIFKGKTLFCFIIIVFMLYFSNVITALSAVFFRHTNLWEIFNIWNFMAYYLLPIIMIYNLSLKLTLLSLKSNDSKACAIDSLLVAFLYAIPCFIEIVCVDQGRGVWIGASVLYLIIEAVIWFVLYRKWLAYGDKKALSNLYKV